MSTAETNTSMSTLPALQTLRATFFKGGSEPATNAFRGGSAAGATVFGSGCAYLAAPTECTCFFSAAATRSASAFAIATRAGDGGGYTLTELMRSPAGLGNLRINSEIDASAAFASPESNLYGRATLMLAQMRFSVTD